jgi:hypothetical protein
LAEIARHIILLLERLLELATLRLLLALAKTTAVLSIKPLHTKRPVLPFKDSVGHKVGWTNTPLIPELVRRPKGFLLGAVVGEGEFLMEAEE